MVNFKVGDRVIGTGYFDNVDLGDREGVIKKIRGGHDRIYFVEWDEKDGDFWDCEGVCEDCRGFNCPENVLRLAHIDNWKERMNDL